MPVVETISACALVAGTLDIVEAMAFNGVRGMSPEKLLQVIASGALGAMALRAGMAAAVRGLAIHYGITLAWAALFVVASLWVAALRKHAVISGLLYGLLIFVVMNFVVLPHSHVVGEPALRGWVAVNAVGALMACMGLPIAIVSRWKLPPDDGEFEA